MFLSADDLKRLLPLEEVIQAVEAKTLGIGSHFIL